MSQPPAQPAAQPAAQPPTQLPLRHHSEGRRRTRQAIVLTALLWPSCAVGAVAGGFVGAITGVIGDDSGGWVALAWAIMGVMIGIAVGAAVLAWIWAHTCGRVRWLPIITLTALLGVSGVFLIVVASRIAEAEVLRTPMRVTQNAQFGPIGTTEGL